MDWNPRYLYRKLFDGDESQVDWFLTHVCTPEWNEEHDMGIPFSQNSGPLIARFPNYERQIRAYRDRWEEMLGGEITASVQILEELRTKPLKLLALTNWSAETFLFAERRFPFFQWFHDIVVSGRIRMKKPEPEIYQHLLQKHGLDISSTVFIDDREVNVATADQLGMIGIRFSSSDQLRAELNRLGIL